MSGADAILHPIPGVSRAHVTARSDEAVLKALSDLLLARRAVAPTFFRSVLAREREYPTGLPTPIPTAIPHTDAEHVLTPGIAVVTLDEPVTFAQMGAPEKFLPVRLVVMLLLTDPTGQVEALQNMLTHLRDEKGVQAVMGARNDQALEQQVIRWLDSGPGAAAPRP
ncbi:MAG: PTS sugar transporter subunit IIA [Brachybacterium sp.]|nr:PTS sugar transporter subunit IIA [Brachybacterium sp.]